MSKTCTINFGINTIFIFIWKRINFIYSGYREFRVINIQIIIIRESTVYIRVVFVWSLLRFLRLDFPKPTLHFHDCLLTTRTSVKYYWYDLRQFYRLPIFIHYHIFTICIFECHSNTKNYVEFILSEYAWYSLKSITILVCNIFFALNFN